MAIDLRIDCVQPKFETYILATPPASLSVEFPAFTFAAFDPAILTTTFPVFTIAEFFAEKNEINAPFPIFVPTFHVLSGAIAQPNITFQSFVPRFAAQRATILQSVFPVFETTFLMVPPTTIELVAKWPVWVPRFFAGLASDGVTVATDYVVWVVNAETKMHSEYTNWQFNSYGEFNGKTFIAMPDGIYELTGDEDGSTQIDAKVYWAPSDLGTNKQKTGWDAYVRLRGSGEPVRLVVTTDEVQKRIYTGDMVNFPKGTHPKRFQSTRALQGRMWQFGFENTQGGDFALEEVEIIPVIGSRRLK